MAESECLVSLTHPNHFQYAGLFGYKTFPGDYAAFTLPNRGRKARNGSEVRD